MHTLERLRRIGPTQIEDVITIHDPQYYTRDWQARFVYELRDDGRLQDCVCGEPHRDIIFSAACAVQYGQYDEEEIANCKSDAGLIALGSEAFLLRAVEVIE